MKVYWSNIEYRYTTVSVVNKCVGGMVYVFVKAKDAIAALDKIRNALLSQDKIILKCEFVNPYNVKTEIWAESKEFGSAEKTTEHYKELYQTARQSKEPVFDYFFEYEKL